MSAMDIGDKQSENQAQQILSVKAPAFIPTDELNLNEEKDIDIEVKSCGFIGLSRVSIVKNSQGSRDHDDASRD